MRDHPAQRTRSGQPDDREPAPERQAELRAAYEANVAAGRPPYVGVRIQTRGELLWVMREREWTGGLDAGGRGRPDLRGANLIGVNLSGVRLREANLSGASLLRANLTRAVLVGTNLSGAYLEGASLQQASFDETSRLHHAHLQDATLGQGLFDHVNLTGIPWGEVHWLGDEQLADATKSLAERVAAYQDAARAYRSLAVALRAQGLSADARRFDARAAEVDRYEHRYAVLLRLGALSRGPSAAAAFGLSGATAFGLSRAAAFGRWLREFVLGTLVGVVEKLSRLFVVSLLVAGLLAAVTCASPGSPQRATTAATWTCVAAPRSNKAGGSRRGCHAPARWVRPWRHW